MLFRRHDPHDPAGRGRVRQGIRRDERGLASTSDARRSRTSARRLAISGGAYKRRVTRPSRARGTAGHGRSHASRLLPTGTLPPGMVLVPGGTVQAQDATTIALAAVLHRRLRGHESRLQAVRRRRRLRNAEYWTEPFVKDGRTRRFGRGDGRELARPDRPARAVDLGAGHLPARAGRFSGARRELVQSRGLRGVRGQEAADRAPLAAGRERRQRLLGHPRAQQLQRKGPRPSARTRGSASSAPTTWPATSRSGSRTRSATSATSSAAPGTNRTTGSASRIAVAVRPVANNGFRCMRWRRARRSPRRSSRPIAKLVARLFTREACCRRRVPDLSAVSTPTIASDLKAVVESTDDSSEFWRRSASRTPPRMAASASSPICSSRRTRSRRIRRSSTSRTRAASTSVVPAIGDELPGVYRQGRPRAAVSDVQGHLRTAPGTSAGWPKRRRDLDDPADEGPAAIGGLRRNASRPGSPSDSRSSA